MTSNLSEFWIGRIITFQVTERIFVQRSQNYSSDGVPEPDEQQKPVWVVLLNTRYVRTRPTKRFPTGVWIWQPLPTARSKAFVRHTRFTLAEAHNLALQIAQDEEGK